METENFSKTYELSYHLLPELEEAMAIEKVQELEQLISKEGGFVIASQQPKKVKLSYAIHHHKNALFGVVDFNGPSEIVERLKQHLKLNGSMLRHLVVSKSKFAQKELRILGQQKNITANKTKRSLAPQNKDNENNRMKKMDKDIESIIEKI